jgi:hypothetical protein
MFEPGVANATTSKVEIRQVTQTFNMHEIGIRRVNSAARTVEV